MAKMAAPRIRQRGERAEKVESLIYMRFRGRPHGFTTEKPKKEYRACFPCREPISIQLFPPSSRPEPLFFAPKPVRPLMLIDARYLDYFARLETVGGEREEGGER